MGGFNRWSVRAVCFAGAQMFFASTQIHDRLQEEWLHPQFGYTRCIPDEISRRAVERRWGRQRAEAAHTYNLLLILAEAEAAATAHGGGAEAAAT